MFPGSWPEIIMPLYILNLPFRLKFLLNNYICAYFSQRLGLMPDPNPPSTCWLALAYLDNVTYVYWQYNIEEILAY